MAFSETGKKRGLAGRHWTNFFIGVSLLILLMAIYGQVIGFDYVNFDDNSYIYNNPHVANGLTLNNLFWALTTFDQSNWHPVTWISYLIDMELFGADAGGQHVVNLIFHIANSILLFILLKKMTSQRLASALVAFLFAVHPLHVESVAWISERKDVLSTLFLFLCLYAYHNYIKNPLPYTYVLIFILFALGLMAKPMLVTFPFVLLLLDIWPLERVKFWNNEGDAKAVKRFLVLVFEKLPFFLLTALSALLTFLAQKQGDSVASNIDALNRLGNALSAYIKYLYKTVAPFHLSVFYPYPEKIESWHVILSASLLLAIFLLSIRYIRKLPWLFVGFCWYLGTLVPVIGIIQVGNQAMADRYTYIPLIGIFIIVSWGVDTIIRRFKWKNPLFMLFGTGLIAYFSVLSFFQVGVWKDSIALFQHSLKHTENNYVAHTHLGVAYAKKGRDEKALKHYRAALSIKPTFFSTWNSLAGFWMDNRQYQKALNCYRKALQNKQGSVEILTNKAVAHMALGEIDKAISLYHQSIRDNGNYYPAHHYLGLALIMKGRLEKAIQHFNTGLQIFPGDREIRHSLALAQKMRKRLSKGARDFKTAMNIAADDPKLLEKAKHLLSTKLSFYKAIKSYKKTISLQPGFKKDMLDLDALVHMTLLNDRYVDLLPVFIQGRKDYPDDPIIAYHLGCIYALKKEKKKASQWIKTALRKGFDNWQVLHLDPNLNFLNNIPNYSKRSDP